MSQVLWYFRRIIHKTVRALIQLSKDLVPFVCVPDTDIMQSGGIFVSLSNGGESNASVCSRNTVMVLGESS